MGLFDDDEEISVASTLYNMAGDEDNRPDYLKSAVFGAIMAGSDSLGQEIVGGYLNGPGLDMRNFFNYAKRHDFFGLPINSYQQTGKVDPAVVATQIGTPSSPAGLEIQVTTAEMAYGTYNLFAEKYIMDNMLSRLTEDWVSSYDSSTNTIVIQFGNGDIESFNPVGYSPNSVYVDANYYYMFPSQEGAVIPDATQSILALPDLTGWTEESLVESFTSTPLTRTANVVVSYNNGDPDENSSYDASTTGELHTTVSQYTRTIYVSDNGGRTEWDAQTYDFTATDYVTNDYVDVTVVNEDLGGGVIKTTTTTVTGEQVTDRWDSTLSHQQIIEGEVYDQERKFIYRIGDGNATLDALYSEAAEDGWEEFYPYIPLRLKNKALDHPDYASMYDDCKQMYRKATKGKRIDDVLATIEDNENVDDIDYATIMYGVSLNVKENAARMYLYEFFNQWYEFDSNSGAMAQYLLDVAAYEQALQDLEAYEATDWENTPYYSRPSPPVVPSRPSMSQKCLRIKTNADNRTDKFDIRTYWNQIDKQLQVGTYTWVDPDTAATRPAKINECMLKKGTTISYQVRDGYTQSGTGDNATQVVRYKTVTIPSIDIYKQTGEDSYTVITVYGLLHKNVIYEGESVKIKASEALDDDDPSGFIIPLHHPTVMALGIKNYTQLSTACVHILFNSYEVVTTKWYEKGIFKIILVILVLVIAVIVFPGAFAGGGGLLGGNLAIGTAAGLTGTAALVVGVVANYLAAMVISQVISTVSTQLFGEKWGALVSALLGFALGFVMGGMQFDMKQLFNLTNALANGYAGYMQGETAEMYADAAEDREKYEKEMERIQKLIDDLYAGNDLYFDPLSLTDTAYGNEQSEGSYIPETADQFIQRTMLNGTDLLEISQSLIYDHSQISLTLPQPQGT